MNFEIYNFSWIIQGRLFVGSIVNIRNECHGGMNQSVQQTNPRKPLSSSQDLFVPLSNSFPHEPRKKDTHSLSKEADLSIQTVALRHHDMNHRLADRLKLFWVQRVIDQNHQTNCRFVSPHLNDRLPANPSVHRLYCVTLKDKGAISPSQCTTLSNNISCRYNL